MSVVFSENLCKRALDVTAGVIVEATRIADILAINANPSKCLRRFKCQWEHVERTPEDLFLSVLNPHLSTNSLVLCGSWSGHKNE